MEHDLAHPASRNYHDPATVNGELVMHEVFSALHRDIHLGSEELDRDPPARIGEDEKDELAIGEDATVGDSVNSISAHRHGLTTDELVDEIGVATKHDPLIRIYVTSVARSLALISTSRRSTRPSRFASHALGTTSP